MKRLRNKKYENVDIEEVGKEVILYNPTSGELAADEYLHKLRERKLGYNNRPGQAYVMSPREQRHYDDLKTS